MRISIVSAIAALALWPSGCSSRPPAPTPSGPVPDLLASVHDYTDVTADFTTPAMPGVPSNPSVHFARPGTFECAFGMPPNTATQQQLLICTGVLPGVTRIPINDGDSTTGACDIGAARANTGELGSLIHYRSRCPADPDTKILQPGQKVAYGAITCAVTHDDATVCINGLHGFVLKQSGSWGF